MFKWTKSKSAGFSLICTRVLIAIFAAAAVALPFLLSSGAFYGRSPYAGILYMGMPKAVIIAIFISIYACFIPAMIALFSLDRLLRNIKLDLVFMRDNVKYLRIISWCCFAIAAVLIYSWFSISYVFAFVAAAAAFFGLLMRVVKNVIDAAREIKDENDYTI